MTDDDAYKLADYVSEIDSGEHIAIYLRGYLDLPQAKRVLISFAKEELGFDDDEVEQLSEPKHERWRKIPHPEHGSIFKLGFGRGSFPVTVMDFQEWSR